MKRTLFPWLAGWALAFPAGAGVFALRDVVNSRFHASRGLPDIQLDKVAEKTVLPAALPGLGR
ncbi:MAG: hypothetical protein ACLPX8_10555 [Bryobacteraceae bacterium]|jgi:hypothetical protein